VISSPCLWARPEESARTAAFATTSPAYSNIDTMPYSKLWI
jgi:hypothetical protein